MFNNETEPLGLACLRFFSQGYLLDIMFLAFFSLFITCKSIKCFHRLHYSLPNLPTASETIYYASSGLSEQGNFLSFLRDHVSPWSSSHIVEKQQEIMSSAGQCSARNCGYKSAFSARGLGHQTGTQAWAKVLEVLEGATSLCPWPWEILQQLQLLFGCPASLSPGLLTLRLLSQIPNLPAYPLYCALQAFSICSPFSYWPSIPDPSAGWAHFLPGSKECLRRQSTQNLFLW